jgi:hypothetical protein
MFANYDVRPPLLHERQIEPAAEVAVGEHDVSFLEQRFLGLLDGIPFLTWLSIGGLLLLVNGFFVLIKTVKSS